MAVNRQSQKQRRAARNRAQRAAIAARSENAAVAASADEQEAPKPSRGEKRRRSESGGGAGRAERVARGSGRPGDRAVMLALLLAILMAGFMLFLRVPVDDRGDPLPPTFKGVTLEAREILTNQDIPSESISIISANGPVVLVFVALPVVVCGFALWATRRPGAGRSRLLTFAMLALAGVVLLGGGILFMPSLIALAVASFQVRKAEMPARVAEQVVGPGSDGVIDAESEEVDPSDDDAEPDDEQSGDVDR